MAKVLLFAMLLCVMAVPGAWAADATPEPESVARDQALQKLTAQVQLLQLNKQQTVEVFLKTTSLKPEQYKAALLQGAEELPPTCYLEDYRAQVTVRIMPETLVANIKSLQEEAPDVSALEKMSEAIQASGTSMPMLMKDVPGWAGVNERTRLDLDSAAHAEAIKKLLGLLEGKMVGKSTLKELMEQTPAVKDAVEKFLNTERPASRTYYADGTVAVVMNVGGASHWNSLSETLKPAKPEDAAVVDLNDLAEAAKRDAGDKMTVTGYARRDGKPVDVTQLTAPAKPVEIPSTKDAASSLMEGK